MNKFSIVIEKFIREKQESKGRSFCVAEWLDSASRRAAQISIATHVVKFLHPDAKGTNVNVKIGQLVDGHGSPYITTASLCKVKDDVVGNAAAMDVGTFLQLEVDGVTLLDLIAKDDFSPFVQFAESESKLLSWMSGFKSVLIDAQLSSDTLAKQVYFPVEEGGYHLLAPLHASSLSHALHDKIKEARYGEKAKIDRDCKRKGTYSDGVVCDYPNLACQTFGGTKPLNISRLNSLRGGKSFLLRSTPPVWMTFRKPPMKKNAFWRDYHKRADSILRDFQRFVISLQHLDSNRDRRHQCQEYLDRLLDLLLQAAAEVQSMKSGWSVTSEIPLYEQIWLDPMREEFVEARESGEWMDDISGYFSKSVLVKLNYKNLNFTDVNYDHLKNECLKMLKGAS